MVFFPQLHQKVLFFLKLQRCFGSSSTKYFHRVKKFKVCVKNALKLILSVTPHTWMNRLIHTTIFEYHSPKKLHYKDEKESNTLQGINIYPTNIGAIFLKLWISKVYCLNFRNLKFGK